jgi:aspartate aminotransferase
MVPSITYWIPATKQYSPNRRWFCYEPLLLAAAAVPRKGGTQSARIRPRPRGDRAAISPRTRLVIVNTPHNPTGRIYSRNALEDLADLLERASSRIGHRIYLLSDEALSPTPVRRQIVRQPGNDLTVDAHFLQLRQGLARTWAKTGYLRDFPLMPVTERRALSDSM